MLGSLVVLYLFLGGCGAAVLAISALWSLLFSRTRSRTRAQSLAFARLRGRLYAASFIVLAIAALCLFLDLGRPERVLYLFFRPTFSLISVGTFALSASLLLSAFLAVANMLGEGRVPSAVRKAVEVIALAPSAVMLAYTGLYMAWIEAVPLWSNPTLPWLLALSSLSSGAALVLVLAPFLTEWKMLAGWLLALRRAHSLTLVLEVIALVCYVAIAARDPFSAVFLAELFGASALGAWFLFGFILLGLWIPLAAEVFGAVTREVRPRVLPEVLCIAGGLILRFCLVMAGTHWLG